MKSVLFFALFSVLTLFMNQSAYADSVQSYEFTYTGTQSNAAILYDANSTNPYNFTPKYVSIQVTNSNATCALFGNSNFRLYADINQSSSLQISNLKLFTNCTTGKNYIDVEGWLQYSGANGLSIPSADFKTDLTYSIWVYSADPTSATPDCPACPECEDCDEPAIVRIFKDGFWAVATAFVSLIVPVLALFLVFRLVHDFFWGRG